MREQKRFEFRAEFFNIWNHVNPVFEPVGEISEEPQPVEFGTPQFGFAQGRARPAVYPIRIKVLFLKPGNDRSRRGERRLGLRILLDVH